MIDLRNGEHHSKSLQRAFIKYGASSFIFRLIEEVEKDLRFKREIHYIEFLNPEYNVQKAKNGFFVYTHLFNEKYKKANILKKTNKGLLANLPSRILTVVDGIVLDFNEGMLIKDLSVKYGVSQPALLNLRKKLRKEKPEINLRKTKSEYGIEELNESIAKLLDKYSHRQIAAALNVSKSTVHYRINKYNLKYAMPDKNQ